MRRPITSSCLIAGTTIGLAACGSPDDTTGGRELEVALSADEYSFSAAEAIEIRAGDAVTFSVRNDGDLDHQLEVLSSINRSLGMTERISPGARREVWSSSTRRARIA